MTAVKSLRYASDTNAGGSQSVTLTYNIQCFDEAGKPIESAAVGGITSVSPSAAY